MDREEMLGREDEAWERFAETVRAVPADRREVEGVVPGWTVHDLVWHVGYWAGYAADVIERDRAGETDLEPAGSQLEEAEIVATGRGMSWDEVVRRTEQGRDRVRAAFSSSPDPGDTAVGWFRDDTFDHYDEHTAEIRAFVA
jgi:uncharacterized protein (TIGR03083 family)